MKNKLLLFSFFIIILSCKKSTEILFDFDQITNLKNYKIKKKKINDSISKIEGVNNEFRIEGEFNEKNKSKRNWWTIESVNKKLRFEIEFLDFDKEYINQMKFYENDKFVKSKSLFIETKSSFDNYNIIAYFPNDNFINTSTELSYRIGDTITKKLREESKITIKGQKENYNFKLKKQHNDNSIAGYITQFSEKKSKRNDSIELGAKTIFFKYP